MNYLIIKESNKKESNMSEQLRKDSFEPFINDIFEVITDNGTVEVELYQVSEQNNEHMDCFSVLFKAPKDQLFIQKIYKVKHAKMGEIELFLVPVVYMKQDGIYYESVFNRLKDIQ